MAIKWSEENLPTLGRFFLMDVLENMRGHEKSSVRFGETGCGQKPNYQVTFPNGVVMTLRGSSHKPYETTDEFKDDNISMSFGLADVHAAKNRA